MSCTSREILLIMQTPKEELSAGGLAARMPRDQLLLQSKAVRTCTFPLQRHCRVQVVLHCAFLGGHVLYVSIVSSSEGDDRCSVSLLWSMKDVKKDGGGGGPSRMYWWGQLL